MSKLGEPGEDKFVHNAGCVPEHSLALNDTTGAVFAEDAEAPPNGGLGAWIQVFAGHLVIFNTFGYINSYGIFQEYYAITLDQPPSNISWIGSTAIFLVYGLGTFSGRAMDAGYYRITMLTGLSLQVLAVFMTSLSTKYWQLFLAQGLCQGIANGLLLCPTLANISTYFSTKRAFAMSCAATGGGTGGIVFPAIAQSLLHTIGFPWTIRIMGFVFLVNAILIGSLARARIHPQKSVEKAPLIDWEAFRDIPYLLYCVGIFLTLWGTFFAYFYVRPFATNKLHVPDKITFDLLLIINAVGIPGRIIAALISDRWTGPVNALIPTACVGGILLFCWAAVESLGGLYAFVTLFGLPGGAVQSLFPAGVSSFTSDVHKIGIRMGMVFTIASLGSFSGPPIAGALVQTSRGSYLGAQVFGGTVMIGGSLLFLAARLRSTGLHLSRRL